MSKPIYLYRAVLSKPRQIEDWENGELVSDVLPVGTPLGRRSGYLSRSGAARWLAGDVEIVRSEPVVFLTHEEKLRAQIEGLLHELEALEQEVQS